jgi:hypothetical protein
MMERRAVLSLDKIPLEENPAPQAESSTLRNQALCVGAAGMPATRIQSESNESPDKLTQISH